MNAADIIEFCLKSESLKRLTRTGWVLAGETSSSCETIASHCWGTSLIAFLLANQLKMEGKNVNSEKLLTMAIIHDLPEAVISDIPYDAVRLGGSVMESAKREAERNAARQTLEPLGVLGQSLIREWEEFENSSTLEARIVIAADRLDMLAHAVSLENAGFSPQRLQGFFDHVRGEIDALHLDVARVLFEKLYDLHMTTLRSANRGR